MPKLSAIFILCIVLLFTASVFAQGTVATSVQAGGGRGLGAGTVLGFGGSMLGSGNNFAGTKNRPFSADIINETDQYFADGNHVHREMRGRIFRDSEGRTRQEVEFVLGSGLHHEQITILDPAGKVYINLDPQSKIARVYPNGPLGIGTSVSAAAPVSKAAVRTAPASSAPAKPDSVATRVAPGVMAGNFSTATEIEQLGTMDIEGFSVTGTRRTNTIPAGTVGNDKPIISSFEIWSSSDLQIDLLSIIKQPQIGTTVYKLVNIRAGEPDPQLFEIPADYTKEAQQQ